MFKVKQIIKRIIPESLIIAYHCHKLIQDGDAIVIYGRETFNKRAHDAIATIYPDLMKDNQACEKMRRQMAYGWAKWKAHPSEFLLMNMDKNDSGTNDTKLTDCVRDQIICRYCSIEKFRELSYKFGVYQRLKEFFGRECIVVNSSTEWEEFKNFILKHKKIFVKPEYGSYGKGAQIIEDNEQTDLKRIFYKLNKSEWIAEEFIEQDIVMSKWNPSSVNTVRIPSIMTKDGVKILAPFMRAGRKGSIIDNAGGGGILIPFDAETGLLEAPGRSEDGQYHMQHPDTKISFDGQIPRYEELINLNMKVHKKMKDHKYLGNDYALTPNGWVLIESNWGQFVAQYANQKGVRIEFETLMAQ